MAEEAYLRTHKGVHKTQYRAGRRAKPTGAIVLHTFQSPLTMTAHRGAEIIRGSKRSASYHRLGDLAGNEVQLVRYADEAWHDGTGSNRWSIGISLMMMAESWPTLTEGQRRAMVNVMASMAVDAAEWLKSEHGITVPARRLSRASSNAGFPGFISHGDRDPARRSDPGAGFPWHTFLSTFEALRGDKPPPTKGPTMPTTITLPGSRDATIRRIQTAAGLVGDDVDGDPYVKTAEAVEALAADRDKYRDMAHEYDGRIKGLQAAVAAKDEKLADIAMDLEGVERELDAVKKGHAEKLADITRLNGEALDVQYAEINRLNDRIQELETNEVALTPEQNLALRLGAAALVIRDVLREDEAQ